LIVNQTCIYQRILVFVVVFLGTGLIIPDSCNAAIRSVWVDGWMAAGNKSVGTAIRYMRIGQWDKAESELRKILGYRPENHAAQYDLGICYERKGDLTTAKRFYEKAIEIRPEFLYCEAIARMEEKAGKGVEYLTFLKPCFHDCDHGFAFARSGMWEEAIKRFKAAYYKDFSALNAFNLAVAMEVIGRRNDAISYFEKADGLSGTSVYDSFAEYLNTAPDFSLHMRVSLPVLSSVTDFPIQKTLYIAAEIAAVRTEPSLEAPVLTYAHLNSPVGILHETGAWVRVRTQNQKEGFIPRFMVEKKPDFSQIAQSREPDSTSSPVPKKTSSHHMSSAENQKRNYSITIAADKHDSESDSDKKEISQKSAILVRVQSQGNSVAVRQEPSLLSEIVGYIDPGKKLKVIQSNDPIWFEIISPDISGYIMRRYIEINPQSKIQ